MSGSHDGSTEIYCLHSERDLVTLMFVCWHIFEKVCFFTFHFAYSAFCTCTKVEVYELYALAKTHANQ